METILQNIYNDILELSDIEKQKEYWGGKNNEYISSFVEVMCRLFDDNDFNNFVDKKAAEIGLSSDIIIEMNKLRTLLNNYQEGEKTDAEILDDPEWHKVADQAKVVIAIWKVG